MALLINGRPATPEEVDAYWAERRRLRQIQLRGGKVPKEFEKHMKTVGSDSFMTPDLEAKIAIALASKEDTPTMQGAYGPIGVFDPKQVKLMKRRLRWKKFVQRLKAVWRAIKELFRG